MYLSCSCTVTVVIQSHSNICLAISHYEHITKIPSLCSKDSSTFSNNCAQYENYAVSSGNLALYANPCVKIVHCMFPFCENFTGWCFLSENCLLSFVHCVTIVHSYVYCMKTVQCLVPIVHILVSDYSL